MDLSLAKVRCRPLNFLLRFLVFILGYFDDKDLRFLFSEKNKTSSNNKLMNQNIL